MSRCSKSRDCGSSPLSRPSETRTSQPAGLEDATEFGQSAWDIEPMEGAAGGDHVDRGIGVTGGFGCGVADVELRPGGEELIAGGTHLVVGFDGDDRIFVGEEDFGEHSGTGADVCDEPVGLKAAPVTKQRKNYVGWITLAVTIIGCGASCEAFGVVHTWMIGWAAARREGA